MKKHTLFFAFVTGLCLSYNLLWGQAVNNHDDIPVIPYPQTVSKTQGVFTISSATVITIPTDGKFMNEAMFLQKVINNGLKNKVVISKKKQAGSINLLYDASLTTPESYRLTISQNSVSVSANDADGMFHAVATIRQLLPLAIETHQAQPHLILPAITITDAPAYAWRGMHLDVSRHFFSISYLKKFIDVLALYKMNKLHLHLTDDQGWRIEIKKYPKLTEEGAWRTFNNQDSVCMKRAKDNPDFNIDQEHIIQRNGKTLYGGFYTQAQMKDVVAYAAARHIDIIPEIDMPGHMMAAITAYPFLTANGENKWGENFTKPICPCNESTFEFAENVFSEIMDIFPSKFIHIGGDEVDRSEWGKSEACKALMQKEGIKDLPALQSYFINRMERYFNSKGRKLIGWDEILEGGISPTAIVMYWRTWVKNAPYLAAKNGNTVIMTPGSPLYFDSPADKNSIDQVYHFNPIPAGLTTNEAKAIIGAQANIWTEYIPSENRADYMYMPRMTALAELLWTNQTDRYTSYLSRLNQQYKRLDALNVHYRLPDIPNIVQSQVFTDQLTLNLNAPLAGYTIRYTSDGTLPNRQSPKLINRLVNKSEQFKIAVFAPNGRRGDVYDVSYQKQELARPVNVNVSKPGLQASYYKHFFKKAVALNAASPDSSFIASGIKVPSGVTAPSFGIKFNGYIQIPQDGIYTFFLTCDDGGILNVADRLAVDNDGLHSAIEKTGQAALKAGLQPFTLNFIEGGGGYTLKLKYSFNGSEPQEIPEGWFSH